MKQILEFLDQSLEDGVLSKSERKALKAIISDEHPNKRELDWLRSQIFDIAKAKIKGYENVQILDWLEASNKLILPKTGGEAFSKVYFSPGDECLNAINEQISYATKGIDICVFTISDDRIKNKLLYAQSKGVKIRIITDNDKSFDRGSDIRSLSDKGMPIKIDTTDHHMHNKFAVFDNTIALTGSYNWTRSAAEYNQENVLVTNDKKAVERFSKEFSKLWNELSNY